ncbi:S1C family serine protease [Streptomyces luteolus]|uniref:Trypsin-like peptidase domain-containing protein n=1 Tax=Streptomyces luteolus TaxID=3043615 RepID=A0ABT6SQI1_9ACTN|nr:trypsin-like peptidase domain-containing protein [Streptomyces sp. B-S-A12]MDI3417861.1 trypsin-like peptidase domain-containing protein [Streptomyces sp. B-S-A12]
MTETFRHSGEHPEQQPAFASAGSPDGAYGTYPPPPPYDPAPADRGRTRRRARGPVALLAAVALGAAAVGGGTAYAAQELWGKTAAAATTGVNGTNAAAGGKGSVSGVANAVSDSIVEIQAETPSGESTGSGVIITSDGEIITNNHVVSGASTVKVRTNDGRTHTAEVVGTDADKDLALIKVRGASGLEKATLGDSDDVNVGDQVVAIGSPEGLTGTVTSGIISAKDRDVTVSKDGGQDQRQGQEPGQGGGQWPFEFEGRQFNGDTGSSKTTYKALQTDASLNPGNSGGALIDMNGEIIGINSAMYSPSSGSGSSSGSVGLGFAIPIDTVKADLAKLRAGSMD